MKGQYKYSQNSKPTMEVTIVVFLLATLSCKLAVTAQGCSLLDKAAWIALEVLRPVLQAAWQSVPACFCDDATFLQHGLKIVPSIWPLLCVLPG
jgi:hypothetical protein